MSDLRRPVTTALDWLGTLIRASVKRKSDPPYDTIIMYDGEAATA